MTTTIIYKGAYLSELINGKRNYILIVWSNGFQTELMFGQLTFKAQKAAVQQGFTKQSLTINNQ